MYITIKDILLFKFIDILFVLISLSIYGLSTQQAEPNNPCAGNTNPDSVIFVNDYRSCSAYFTCVGTEAFEQNCAGNLHFNPTLQRCDFPNEDGTCADCSPTENNVNFPILDASGLAYECKKFRVCFLGQSSIRECSVGLQFNTESRRCDLTEIVGCVENLCPAVDIPGSPFFLPHPSRCNQYYLCRNGAPDRNSATICPTGTRFVPENQRCEPDPLCIVIPPFP